MFNKKCRWKISQLLVATQEISNEKKMKTFNKIRTFFLLFVCFLFYFFFCLIDFINKIQNQGLRTLLALENRCKLSLSICYHDHSQPTNDSNQGYQQRHHCHCHCHSHNNLITLHRDHMCHPLCFCVCACVFFCFFLFFFVV